MLTNKPVNVVMPKSKSNPNLTALCTSIPVERQSKSLSGGIVDVEREEKNKSVIQVGLVWNGDGWKRTPLYMNWKKYFSAFQMYYVYSRMKRNEEKYGRMYLTWICILDIMFQDVQYKNVVVNVLDSALSTKDFLESMKLIGFKAKNFVKKRNIAHVKVFFVLYKVFVYKCVCNELVHDNSILHMALDYINMVFDHIILR